MNERKVPAWMLEAKPRRKAVTGWDVPWEEWPSIKYVAKFIGCMTFWGFVALLSRSSFPIKLGLFFFFTDDAFIEWVFQKIGIRFVPDTLGPAFVKAFVFLTGLFALLAHWKDSAPQWLSALLPPTDIWWSAMGALALAIAALDIIPAALVKKMLPQFGIATTPVGQFWAIQLIKGSVYLALAFSHWFGNR